jgi:hypothetical protein
MFYFVYIGVFHDTLREEFGKEEKRIQARRRSRSAGKDLALIEKESGARS